jgi:hypothetical protein
MALATILVSSILLCGSIGATSATDPPATLQQYVDDLGSAGYAVTQNSAPVVHPTLSTTGTRLDLEKYGATASVEIIPYASRADMEADWTVVDGQAPIPRNAAPEFDGKSLYWHDASILVVDYASAGDQGTLWIAALVFLGLQDISPDGLPIGTIPAGVVDGGGP